MNILVINASVSGLRTNNALDQLKFSDNAVVDRINFKDLQMTFADGRDFREYDNDNKVIVQKIIDADAIIIGTPIYQAGIPGILKNVFDLLPSNAILNKTVGIIVTAGSPRYYLVAQSQLIPILHYLKANVISKYVFIENNDFTNDILREDIQIRIENLSDTVEDEVNDYITKTKSKYSFL